MGWCKFICTAGLFSAYSEKNDKDDSQQGKMGNLKEFIIDKGHTFCTQNKKNASGMLTKSLLSTV